MKKKNKKEYFEVPAYFDEYDEDNEEFIYRCKYCNQITKVKWKNKVPTNLCTCENARKDFIKSIDKLKEEIKEIARLIKLKRKEVSTDDHSKSSNF